MNSEPEGQIYDCIGAGYKSQRRSDPRIFEQIERALSGCVTVINVGAGTGSYEPQGCTLAVEPSQKMIDQRPPGIAKCIKGVAEKLPVRNKAFDGALASLTMHHWTDVAAGLAEMRRVARKRIVLFTWDPEAEIDFWLTRDYFPAILDLDRPRFPALWQLHGMLGGMEVHPVMIPADCADGFLGAFWKRPEAYLDEEVRRGISAMAQIERSELESGLERLRVDLRTGEWMRRNAKLRPLAELDLGYRIVICVRT